MTFQDRYRALRSRWTTPDLVWTFPRRFLVFAGLLLFTAALGSLAALELSGEFSLPLLRLLIPEIICFALVGILVFY